jgi:hypothetical protein
MGKGKDGGPPQEDIGPDSPTPDLADVTDPGDIADEANAADYSIDMSQSAADGNQAVIPILVPVDDSIGIPNPAGGAPVDPYTGQPPADPTTSGSNTAPASTQPSNAEPGQPTTGSAPADPFLPSSNFLADNWDKFVAQNVPGDWATQGGGIPNLGTVQITSDGTVQFPTSSMKPEGGGGGQSDSGTQQGNGTQQGSGVQQAGPTTTVGPGQPPPPPPPPPTPWSPPGDDLWGGAPGQLPPVPLTQSSPLSSVGQFLSYWSTLPLSTLPPGAQFTPAPLPPLPPGATFYGGQIQSPSSPPPAELTGLVGWWPASTRLDPIPYVKTVTDTGSTSLNYIKGGLLGWENVARLAANVVLVDIQGVLGLLAELNTTLEQHLIFPQAIPFDAVPMYVNESIQYLIGGTKEAFGSARLELAAAQDARAGVGTSATAWGAPTNPLISEPKGLNIPFSSPWRQSYPIGGGIPQGFSSAADFQRFSSGIYEQFGARQISVDAYFQGSSVTGYGHGVAYVPEYGYVARAPFDFMRLSDYDLAIVNPGLVQKAEQLGIELRGEGTRTEPLSLANLAALGLDQIAQSLSAAAGRPVNIMLYANEFAVQRAPSIRAPK